jgi:hypothetical protein
VVKATRSTGGTSNTHAHTHTTLTLTHKGGKIDPFYFQAWAGLLDQTNLADAYVILKGIVFDDIAISNTNLNSGAWGAKSTWSLSDSSFRNVKCTQMDEICEAASLLNLGGQGGQISIHRTTFANNQVPMITYSPFGQSNVSMSLYDNHFDGNLALGRSPVQLNRPLSVEFRHNVWTRNGIKAGSCGGGADCRGGAVQVQGGGNPWGDETQPSAISFSHEVFEDNTTPGRGGHVAVIGRPDPANFQNCNFTRGHAESGGGLYLESAPNAFIGDSHFTLNIATHYSEIACVASHVVLRHTALGANPNRADVECDNGCVYRMLEDPSFPEVCPALPENSTGNKWWVPALAGGGGAAVLLGLVCFFYYRKSDRGATPPIQYDTLA